jgi:hypothetical protein
LRAVTINNMKGTGIPLLELWMNPSYANEIAKNFKYNEDYYRVTLFKNLDLAAAFDSYFSTLW